MLDEDCTIAPFIFLAITENATITTKCIYEFL